MSRILMFSIGLNDYDKKWEPCIISQREYAYKNCYDYCVVNHLPSKLSANESAWLKIPLMLQALEKGYEWVFFTDSDCMFSIDTPGVTSIEIPRKYIYMVLGYSNRVNSGIFIIKNHVLSKKFLHDILLNCDYPILDKKERCLYENGHVIHFVNRSDIVEIIDRKWNNNADPLLKDYIRHYSGIIMKKFYPFNLTSSSNQHMVNQNMLKEYIIKIISPCKILIKFCLNTIQTCLNIIFRPLYKKLLRYTSECKKQYPYFAHTDQ